jgi:hypothetical protein
MAKHMFRINVAFIVIGLAALGMGCKAISGLGSSTKTSSAPPIDFTTPSKGLKVQVQTDKKQTATGKISPAGGTVSLTATNGNKFKLDVPANAVSSETAVTMTVVKTLDGAPTDKNTPIAVQLEPSGLSLQEFATLTIEPAQAIPVKDQVMFVYEGDGNDYHLALIDPKSREIKIKIMGFSGAGVASASDSAWAANLMVQASDARSRLQQKIGEYLQEKRRDAVLNDELDPELGNTLKAALDQFEDQVLIKEMAAAELDCKHGADAMRDLLSLERSRRLIGLEGTSDFGGKYEKLKSIIEKCAAPYRISGGRASWHTDTPVCDIMKPFTLTGGGFTVNFSGGLSGTYNYTGPYAAHGAGDTYTISLPEGVGKPGTMTGGGAGSAGGHTANDTESYTLTPIEPCS